MLTCRDVEVLLQDYLDGYLLPSQREVLESHVRRCEPCRELLGGLSRVGEELDAVEQVDVPEGLAGSILARLPADVYRPSPGRRILAWGLPAAAAAVLVVAVALLTGRYELRGRTEARLVEVVFAAPQAASVAVVGDFNGWNPRRNAMVRMGREGTWRVRLRIPPGVYQYSFVVDGREWLPDPAARSFVPDGFGGRNSVLVVEG